MALALALALGSTYSIVIPSCPPASSSRVLTGTRVGHGRERARTIARRRPHRRCKWRRQAEERRTGMDEYK